MYPNKFLAKVAGSKFNISASIDEGPYVEGEEYSISLSIFNQGLGNSNGEVFIELDNDGNVFFLEDLSSISISGIESRESVNLDGLFSFMVSPLSQSGSIENININIFDGDNFIDSSSFQLIIGEPVMLINDEFESNTLLQNNYCTRS